MPSESNDRSRILEYLRTLDTTGLSPDVSDDEDEDGDSLAAFGDDDGDDSNCIFPDSSWIDDLRERLLELQDDDCVRDDRVSDGCDSISNCSSDTELSFAAPEFSPCRSRADIDVLVDDELDVIQSDITPSGTALPDPPDMALASSDIIQEVTHRQQWKGFKDVCDNFDVNLKPSFKRFDNMTNSLHYLHHYALLDRIDLSSYSEIQSNKELDLKRILVSKDDIMQLENDAVIHVER